MPPENSAEIFFDRALNRGSQGLPRVLFGYFLHDAKSNNSFPFRELPRFCKPRFSSPQWRLRTNKIKTFPKRSFEVLQTSNQRTKLQLRTNLIKSFENFYILFVRHKKYDKKSLPAGRFEVFQTSNQRTKTSTSHRQY